MDDTPHKPDLIAFTEPGAERLEFVESDVPVVHAEKSMDDYVTILRDFDGDMVGFCLEGDPTQWTATRKAACACDLSKLNLSDNGDLLWPDEAAKMIVSALIPEATSSVRDEAIKRIEKWAYAFGEIRSDDALAEVAGDLCQD